MPVTKDDIAALLKQYQAMKQRIELICFELEHPIQLTDNDIIESMALRHSLDTSVPGTGGISDRTAAIALIYQDIARKTNNEDTIQLAQELFKLENDVAHMEYYVSLLPGLQAQTIRMFYMENNSWPQIQQKLHRAKRTLTDCRVKALENLTEMYQYIEHTKEIEIKA